KGSKLAEIYGVDHARETYQCSYGLNPQLRASIEDKSLRFTGHDDHGEVRAFELAEHPFFVGTLFQPERSALESKPHPLIIAFLKGRALNADQQIRGLYSGGILEADPLA